MNRTLITNIDNVVISGITIRCNAIVINSTAVHGYGTSLDWPVFAIQIFEPGYALDCDCDTPILRVEGCPTIYISKADYAPAKVDTLNGDNTREKTWQLLDERVRQFWPRGRMFPTIRRDILDRPAHPTKSS